MSVIDTFAWGEFRIGDLFEISRPVARSLLTYSPGNIPLIASGNLNNGVVDYVVPLGDERLDEGNCITVSPLDGSAFYQPCDFLGRGGAGSAIIMLRNLRMSSCSGLYIASVIRKSLTHFNYSDQINKETIAEQLIKLPVTNLGNPDWEFMERFMRSLLEKQASKLELLRFAASTEHTPVNIERWTKFEVGSLLSIIPGKGCTKKEINEYPGDLEVVQSTGVNNSITGSMSREYCLEQGYTISENPCLTVVGTGQGAVGYVTYHQGPVVVGNNAKLLLPNLDLTESQMLFLATVLNVLRGRFSYSDIVSVRRYSEMNIYLPVDASGNPDWGYMEDMMKVVLEQKAADLNVLEQLLSQSEA